MGKRALEMNFHRNKPYGMIRSVNKAYLEQYFMSVFFYAIYEWEMGENYNQCDEKNRKTD